VKVFAPWYGQNTDGIDPASCRNVIIYNSTVDVGDDGICLKPGSIASSQKPGPSCENIVIVDCVVYHAHGGFVIGSESFGGVNNVSVRNCVFVGTDVGVRFKSLRGKGGLVENVFIDGIQMREIASEAVLFDMSYGGGSPEVEATKDRGAKHEEQVNDLTPRFQDISFKNIVCNGAGRAVLIAGLPEMPIKGISFENVSVNATKGLLFTDVDGIRLDSCRVVSSSGPMFTINQSRNVVVNGGAFSSSAGPFLTVSGEKTDNIRFVGVDQAKGKNAIVFGANVRTDVVKAD
jgi:DNA sulfur modification protein DndE